MVADKLDALRARLREYGSCLVAYSGGVDSVFLARMAHEVLGDGALAVIADSPSLPRRELAGALAVAQQAGFPVRVIHTREFEDGRYAANPLNRCYFCKHELFRELAPIAREEKLAVIAYGENASDAGDFRPGAQAAAEFLVRAPLKEVGLTKMEIRELSARLGLATAEKPQMACLSSRVPHGEPVTPDKLRMIEAAENFLRDLGFCEVRVRHHELSLKSEVRSPKLDHGQLHTSGPLARIELGREEIPRFLADGISAKVTGALQGMGYAQVILDSEGYRRGGANPALPASAAETFGR